MRTLLTDIDLFVCRVLEARVADGSLAPADVLEADICTLTDEQLREHDQIHLFCGIGGIPLGLQWAGWPEGPEWSIVTGGFPCQDISVAGKGLGVEKGARSGLWKEMHRVIDAVRPRWVLAENVPALRTRGADRVLGDLEHLGYACWALVVGAEHVGAPHRRHRVWIVGHAGGTGAGAVPHAQRDGRGPGSGEPGDQGQAGLGRREPAGGVQLADAGHGHGQRIAEAAQEQPARPGRAGECCEGLAHPQRAGLRDGGQPGSPGPDAAGQLEHALGARREERQPAAVAGHPRLRGWPAPPGPYQHDWEAPRLVESGVGDAADGVSRRLAGFRRRNGLKALGNAVVPEVVELIGRGMIRHEQTR